jgi:hypothetical protein
MRYAFAIAALISLAAGTASATAPSEFTVQGVLRNNTGQLQTMTVKVTVTLYDATSAGNVLAGPFVSNVMVSNGLFTLTIPDANLRSEVAGATEVWVEMTADLDTFPRQKVSSNLFALVCAAADQLSSACSGCVADTMIAGVAGSKVSGKVAAASTADTAASATSATSATTATTATNSTQLGGVAASGYQKALLTSDCGVGKYIRAIAADGTVTCGSDATGSGTVTAVGSGTGLTGGTITSSGTLAVAFGGSGSAGTVAHSDHTHALSCNRINSGDIVNPNVNCAGSIATGGGCYADSGKVTRAYPANNGFYCEFDAGAGTAYAYCCTIN